MNMRWQVLLLASIAIAVVATPDDLALTQMNGCSWTSAKGSSFDLSSLQSTDDYRGDDQYLSFRMNICGGVSASNCQGAGICSFWKDDGSYHQSYGDWTSSPQPQWALIDENRPSAGVKVTFSNGKSMCMGRVETTYMNFVCDPNAPASKQFTVKEDFAACTLTITYTSAKSCPGGGGSGSSGGLSGGSIFLILLFVFGFVYVAAGCWYNKTRRGMNGMEACPNHNIWCGIWDNSKAGCRFSLAKVRQWTGGSGGTTNYSQM